MRFLWLSFCIHPIYVFDVKELMEICSLLLCANSPQSGVFFGDFWSIFESKIPVFSKIAAFSVTGRWRVWVYAAVMV